jgi:phage FluMu protein Com
MDREWRCTRCGKLLGLREGDRLHIRFARGHEYLVGFPVTSICRSCRALNELTEPSSEQQAQAATSKP